MGLSNNDLDLSPNNNNYKQNNNEPLVWRGVESALERATRLLDGFHERPKAQPSEINWSSCGRFLAVGFTDGLIVVCQQDESEKSDDDEESESDDLSLRFVVLVRGHSKALNCLTFSPRFEVFVILNFDNFHEKKKKRKKSHNLEKKKKPTITTETRMKQR